MDLVPGRLYELKSHGLLRFERWDEYMGEVTAQFTMLEYGGGSAYLLPANLAGITRFESTQSESVA